jgi:PKD repeat protein
MKRLYIFLLSCLATTFMITLGSAQPALASHQFLWWDELGDVTFARFGSNSEIVIRQGQMEFVNLCEIGGVNDYLWPATDVYIMPSGEFPVRTELEDVSGVPNTIISPTSFGMFIDESIGSTAGLQPGKYAVIYDECQDGNVDEGDFVLKEAFEVVESPSDVPSLPLFYELKAKAGEKANELLDDLGEEIDDWIKAKGKRPDTPLSKLLYGREDIPFTNHPKVVLRIQLINQAKHYLGIFADPPDPDFEQITTAGPRTSADVESNDPVLRAASVLATESSAEGALAEALLRSLERYQGADQADNGRWALIHARAIRDNSLQLRAQITRSNAALSDLDAALAADTTDVDAQAAEAQTFIERVRASGFNEDELREARNLGLTDAEIGALEADIAALDFAGFSEQSLRQTVQEIKTTNTALAAEFGDLAADMAPVVSALESDPLVADKAPVTDAGGPYTGAEGASVSFAGSATSPSAITKYEWDLDGDGEFDDAVGASQSKAYDAPFHGLVGLRVQNADGLSNVAYARVDIADANGRPVVEAASPAEDTVVLEPGQTQDFSITASDPDGDATSAEWFVDGTSAGTGSSFAYSPSTSDVGRHMVEVRVDDDSPLGEQVRYSWTAAVLVADADGDGYRANTDCDDTDPNINPGEEEVVGNNKDDDCDPATPDGGVPPTADFTFSPEKPAVDAATQFTDASSDPDGTIAAWEWDFGDGATSTAQNPTHTYTSTGSYTVKLIVTDDDGISRDATKTVTVASPPQAFFSPEQGDGQNVALLEGGASVHSFSSQNDNSHTPQSMLNFRSDDLPWATGAGNVTDQWVKILLAGGKTYVIDRVQVQPRPDFADQRVRDFEVAVSTTTADDSAFTTVLQATAADNGRLQEFKLNKPVLAKYVRYRAVNNRGNRCCISTQQFKVITGQEGGRTVTFHNLTTEADSDIVSYEWDFGDGTTSTEESPTHTYPAGSATYDVKLTATDAEGDSDTYVLTQRVLTLPVASFTFTPASPKEGEWVRFTDTSTVPDGGTIPARTWDWGDGTAINYSPSRIIDHWFGDNDSYKVVQTVANSQWQTAQVERTVTPTNVAPSVNLGGDRSWTAGERLNFTPTINDPGSKDTHTCAWDYGDGSPVSTGCTFDHAYTGVEPGSQPRTYTAKLTVTDDDGGVGTGSVNITVQPQAFEQLASGIPNIIGVDWSPLVNKLVVTRHYPCFNDLALVDLDGTVSPPVTGPIARQCDETKIAVSPGQGGFGFGDVFMGNGNPGEIVRVQMNASGTVTQIDNPWVKVPSNGRLRGGVAFDDVGTFGHDLITVWNDGRIFRVDSNGSFSQVADLGRPLEGADVAAQTGFGPASGCILTGDMHGKNLWAACPDKSPFIVKQVPATGEIEFAHFVPAPGDFFFADHDRGRVYKGDSRSFTADLIGHTLVTTEYNGEVWDVYYDEQSKSFQTKLFTKAMVDGAFIHFEQTAFLPALNSMNSSLAPATATNTVGATHTVTATVKDSFGNPVPNLELTFTVSGANSASGKATTDDNGVATYSYTGVNEGEDKIVASSLNATTNEATAIWEQPDNQPPEAKDQSVTTDEDTPKEVTLSATDVDEGDNLSYEIVDSPQHGKLSGSGATRTYTPNENYNGPDSFTFKANDGQADSNTAPVTIDVKAVNDAPVATDDSYEVDEDDTLNIEAPGVLANDEDVDNAATDLEAILVDGTAHGDLTLNPDGSFNYKPNENFFGDDSFTYKANDGTDSADTATVTLRVNSVNDSPTADAGGPYEVDEGGSVEVGSSGSDTEGGDLRYDWDLDDDGTFETSGQKATFSADDGPSTRTIKVRLTDADGASTTDTATVDVNNVVPSITSISRPSQMLTDSTIPFTASATDPSSADTSAGFSWQWSVDGGAYDPGSNPFKTTFSTCGEHRVSAKAVDKDGGVSEPVTASTITAYEGHYQQPLDEGAYNLVQAGRVVPVKVTVGCAADSLTDLKPSIQLLKGDKSDGTETYSDIVETYSVSAADTTGIMRPADSFYIYNLRVPANASAGDLFTIRVRPFGDYDASAGGLYVVLKIRK